MKKIPTEVVKLREMISTEIVVVFTPAREAGIKERDVGRMKKAGNCLFLKLADYIGSEK